ncbi:hypothetical protein [Trichoplusia ni ascovirus 2c]|uniref:hypothetical protein n=1 Tax=Trichoplusia ni ascovirus 2c TaxID=328615 RepID=UPI0000E4420C|nr:hypothetical protein TNAV2c_gp052 [Trichoplusia ni ascovirus 2c]ABF70569.1 hypothetical protein [Trichoplusia ni ascovirus 2c]AUS94156.1 hypothetical protein [Trichoplusia ni ascovirus 6b]
MDTSRMVHVAIEASALGLLTLYTKSSFTKQQEEIENLKKQLNVLQSKFDTIQRDFNAHVVAQALEEKKHARPVIRSIPSTPVVSLERIHQSTPTPTLLSPPTVQQQDHHHYSPKVKTTTTMKRKKKNLQKLRENNILKFMSGNNVHSVGRNHLDDILSGIKKVNNLGGDKMCNNVKCTLNPTKEITDNESDVIDNISSIFNTETSSSSSLNATTVDTQALLNADFTKFMKSKKKPVARLGKKK